MDIHRCRFIPFPASPINALAFSHTTKPGQKTPSTLRLALGRANGDVEIWNPAKGNWSQETIFRGGKNRSIEGLVWTQELDEELESGSTHGRLRLFSIGYSNSITEWNLSNGMPLRHSSGSHAEIWSLAVQPRWRREDGLENKTAQMLAVGCADGSVVLHSTSDGDLVYAKTLRRPSSSKARVLSLTFCDRNIIAAGYSDGTISIYDTRGKGQIKRSMHLGSGPSKSSTYVWSVKCLSDNVLVSGDSTGELKFWDLKTFTVTQRLLCLEADILALAPSADGNTVFCGGMDRKVSIVSKDRTTRRWKEIYHQRIHAGQVKAMASIETKDLSIVVSGGLDAAPVLLPLKSSGQEYTRTLPGLPQKPPILSAQEDRLLVSWWDREVSFCEMNRDLLQRVSVQKSIGDTEGVDHLQHILVQGEENITSVAVSGDGKLLAIATNVSCKMFVLSRRNDGSSTRRIRRLESVLLYGLGARHVSISPDSRWLLIVSPASELSLHRIQPDESIKSGYQVTETSIVLRRSQRSLPKDPLGEYYSTIDKITWSSDSKTLIACDLSGYLDMWTFSQATPRINGDSGPSHSTPNGHVNGINQDCDDSDESENEDDKESSPENGSSWRLVSQRMPKLPASPLLLIFEPEELATLSSDHADSDAIPDHRFVVVTLQHDILEFHTRTGKLTDWSKRNASSELPFEFSQLKDRAMGGVWDIQHGRRRLWLYGSTWLFMLDMDRDLRTQETNLKQMNRKRKRDRKSDGGRINIKKTSGAGDLMEQRNDFGLMSSPDDIHTQDTDLQQDVDEDDEDESSWDGFDEKRGTSTLIKFRRRKTIIDSSATVGQDIESGGADSEFKKHPKSPKETNIKAIPWWITHKYRPILGLVALGQEKETDYDDDDYHADRRELEVALIERPLWDLDLDLPFLS